MSSAANIRGVARRDDRTFALVNARAALPSGVAACDILVRDGLIHTIGQGAHSVATSIDCEGDYLLPGFIELHTDHIERHLEPSPGTFTSVRDAVLSYDAELASRGITTAFDAITLGGDVSLERQRQHLAAIDAIAAAADERRLRIEHFLHVRCELSSPELPRYLEIASTRARPRIVSVMDHTPGQGQWVDTERFRAHYAQRYGLSPRDLDSLIARRRAARDRFGASNHAQAVEFARRHGCVLAGHDAATEADVAAMQIAGCSIAEFPTSLAAARSARDAHMSIVVGAPNLIRGASRSGNVAAAALLRERLADIISSDYEPMSLLRALWLLTEHFHVPLHEACRAMSAVPASVMGLADRGSISTGKRADFVRVRFSEAGPTIVSVWCSGKQCAV